MLYYSFDLYTSSALCFCVDIETRRSAWLTSERMVGQMLKKQIFGQAEPSNGVHTVVRIC
jgi:hypothetical protein